MRPPNPRLADNGSGVDTILYFNVGIDPVLNADEEGNWVRAPVAATEFRAIVTPSFATGVDQNGSELSITTFQVMLYAHNRPFPLTSGPLTWKKSGHPRATLVALGEAVPSGPGCWAFQATEAGPNPEMTGEPDNAQ
jgi:hypothetical protein